VLPFHLHPRERLLSHRKMRRDFRSGSPFSKDFLPGSRFSPEVMALSHKHLLDPGRAYLYKGSIIALGQMIFQLVEQIIMSYNLDNDVGAL
jgi:hypothetical protein